MSVLRGIATTCLLLLPAGAGAQQATPAGCRDLLASAPFLHSGPATAAPDGPDGCRFTDVVFGVGPRFGYQVATLLEHGIPLGALAMPRRAVSVRVEARGVVFVLHSGQPKTDWLSRQQQVPFDIVLDGSYDPGSRTAVLNEFSMDGPAIGRAAASGVADAGDGPDWTDKAGLRSVALHLDSRRFLLAFLLPSLLPFLPDDDPGGAVDRAKAQAVAAVRLLVPQSGATPATVDALAAAIADFPHPQRVLDVRVTAASPVTAEVAQAAAASPAALAALMRRLEITASYAGAAR